MRRRLFIRFVLTATIVAPWLGSISLVASAPSPQSGLPAGATGEQIFRAACITCHGPDGTGGAVTFEPDPPDFTDCAFATGEADLDWFAVVHDGGPIRGLDHRLPAFGDALTEGQIVAVVDYLRGFCAERSWPRGDLNLPRAFFTEKAFPENEAVWTIGLTGGDERSVGNEFVYERRLGTRSQFEAVVPFDAFATGAGQAWTRGIGDIAVAFKHTVHASLPTGTIAAAGAELIVPTGNSERGLGTGTAILEPFAMWGMLLPRNRRPCNDFSALWTSTSPVFIRPRRCRRFCSS
jgi:mono/diheme cytochrome c family protein